MRAIYLIARREYLSYVATWGFWISLISLPIIMVLGATVPVLIENSKPVRYFTIIDETGQGYGDMIEASFQERRRERQREIIEGLSVIYGEDRIEAALSAFDQEADLEAARQAAIESLNLEQAQNSLNTVERTVIQVAPPAQNAEGLRPYLTGATSIQTEEGPKPLFAAMIIRNNPEITEDTPSPIIVDYYSTNVTDRDLSREIRTMLEEHLQLALLTEAGLTAEDIERIENIRPDVRSFDPSATADEDTEVTLADRLPFIVALFMAFMLWIAIFSVANMLLTSMIEEKGGKVIELMLATSRYSDILIGKLLGVAATSFTLMGSWFIIALVASILGQQALMQVDPELGGIFAEIFTPELLIPAAGYFIVGYLMFGATFLALGSLCETMHDAQSLMTPLIFFLMAPMLLMSMSIQASDSWVYNFAAWVPFWTPFMMMTRLPHEPPMWELIGTTVVMLITLVLVLWGASAIFRQGTLGQANVESVKGFFGQFMPKKKSKT